MSEIRRIAAGVISPLYEIGVRDEQQRIVNLLIQQPNNGLSIIDIITLIKGKNDGKNV